MRKFKSAMLALSILLSLVVVMGCQPIPQTKVSSLTVKFTTPAAKSLAARSLTGPGGALGNEDTFTFTCFNENGGFYLGNSTDTSSALFSLSGSNPYSVTPDGNPALNLFDVTVGKDAAPATFTVSPGNSFFTGSYDEALLSIITSAWQVNSTYMDYGPRFSIDHTGTPGGTIDIYGLNGAAGYTSISTISSTGTTTPDNPLYLKGAPAVASVSTSPGAGFICFVPLSSGLTTPVLKIVTLTSSDDLYAAVGVDKTNSYWVGFYNKYCGGPDSKKPIATGSPVLLEFIPINKTFDFGDGTNPVTLTVIYDPSAAGVKYYDNITNPLGVGAPIISDAPTGAYLDVEGTPPLNFTADVTTTAQ